MSSSHHDMFAEAARVLRDIEAAARVADKFTDGRWQVRCDLCRYDQAGVKQFSSRRDVCLSCGMRGSRPRWVNISGYVLTRMREACGMSQSEMAVRCGWSRVRQVRLEGQPRMSCATSCRVATAFVAASADGLDIRRVIEEWPLFVLLADRDVIDQATDGLEKLDQLGEE